MRLLSDDFCVSRKICSCGRIKWNVRFQAMSNNDGIIPLQEELTKILGVLETDDVGGMRHRWSTLPEEYTDGFRAQYG